MDKSDILNIPIEHIDVTTFDASPIIRQMRGMSFSARETASAADLLVQMLQDEACTVVLTIAGSTGAAGCLKIYADMIRYRMVDVVVATGASIVDMDFFEAIGNKHYRGEIDVDDRMLRDRYIDRIYDTYIDEEELQKCDETVRDIANDMKPGVYSSRAFIRQMGRYLAEGGAVKSGSLVEEAYRSGVPIFCPAFSDSSAGFGLVMHQEARPDCVSIDSVRDFRELTEIKLQADTTGLFIIGGGVPKNFVQDTVICAEVLGHDVPMHAYAVQITVADVRDGACSSSTLKEANSWGKVADTATQMVYAEASSVLPLIVSYAYHEGSWQKKKPRNWSRIFDS
ncbi:MAG: deoxyhypusine synthase [Spirochaetales bacterium]|nr:deoxyhypusine synthase [Spirochaetales bacterium]